MTNPTLEQRAREWLDRLCASQPAEIDIEEGDELIPLDTAIRAMLTFSHTGVEQAIEACAKDGWVMVPREPTEAMLARGNEAYGRKAADMASPTPTEFPEGGPIEYAWRAMCAPAPDTNPLPAQSPDDIAYAGAVPSPVNVEGLVEASGLVPGPTWHVDADDCWTSEIQVVGGYYVVATIYGGTEAEAIARRDATLIALASLSPDGER